MQQQAFHRWRPSLYSIASTALGQAMALNCTVLGNVQLIDWKEGALSIVAQRGFDDAFLSSFERVRLSDGTACARAAYQRKPILIGDVRRDPKFEPYVSFARAAGFSAVLSTPMISSGGALMGVLSVHFVLPRLWRDSEIRATMLVAERAAGLLVRCAGEGAPLGRPAAGRTAVRAL